MKMKFLALALVFSFLNACAIFGDKPLFFDHTQLESEKIKFNKQDAVRNMTAEMEYDAYRQKNKLVKSAEQQRLIDQMKQHQVVITTKK